MVAVVKKVRGPKSGVRSLLGLDPGRWMTDRRGSVLVQAIPILIIFILVVAGGFTVWKVISIKQSLHSGTYQAARYLSLNPVDPGQRGLWHEVAWEFVARELANNGFVGRNPNPSVEVLIAGGSDELSCGLEFKVEAGLTVQIGMPYLSMNLNLRDQHNGRVECR